jgi:AraC-like DNA-binding protein
VSALAALAIVKGPFLRVAIADLTDYAFAIDEVWGAVGARLVSELCELDEGGRIDRLEAALAAHLVLGRPRTRTVDVAGLATSVLRRRGRVSVEAMALAAGVSRQHLTREFRERLGISPKLYCRLARFHSGLVHAGRRASVDWAQAAIDLGYADQSHMIAEFRQFSALTPHALAHDEWFHPFIERAKRHESWRSP